MSRNLKYEAKAKQLSATVKSKASKNIKKHTSEVVGFGFRPDYKPEKASHNYLSSIIMKKSNVAEWKMSPLEKMDMVKEGLSKIDLELLKAKTNLDYEKLSILLSTTRATLINKKGRELYSPVLGERIVSIADVYSYGFEVFEDETKFNQWVFKPNRALGGKQPFELLGNQFGREEVKNLIGRIEYGVYA